MRIKFNGSGQSGRLIFKEGEEIDLPDARAYPFLATGVASKVEGSKKDKERKVKSDG